MRRKVKYIIGMIWWQFRKKKVKRRLFERIRALETRLSVKGIIVPVDGVRSIPKAPTTLVLIKNKY